MAFLFDRKYLKGARMNLEILKLIQSDSRLKHGLFKGHYGLEKENIRVTEDGHLALTKHPSVFGDKLYNPYFYNDFSESQVELITPVFDNLKDCYHFLSTINELFMNNIGEELLWPQSAPPILPEDKLIPIADFGESEVGLERKHYREVLAKRYGKKKQMISGIHFNFSLDPDFLQDLYKTSKTEASFIDFKNGLYLKICRNFIKYAWLPTYLFGASPATDSTYMEACVEHMKYTSKGDPYFEFATSIRNGVCGYRNHNNYIISYDSVDRYIGELQDLIHTGNIQNEKEYYSPIRLKTHSSDDFMTTLKEEGIMYIEIRLLDIDPFDQNGISLDTMEFMHLFLLFLLFKEEDCFGDELHQISLNNYELVAGKGRTPGLLLEQHINEHIRLSEWGIGLLEELEVMMDSFGFLDAKDHELINRYIIEMGDPSLTKSAKVLSGIKEKGFINWHLQLSKTHFENSKDKPYILKGCEILELSTQILIKDAIKRGIKVELLDQEENFIMLRKDDHVEYIKQATKTSLDTYNSFLIMENKVVTKEILDRAGIRVPKGGVYSEIQSAIDAYDIYATSAFVIKPKSTNFGIGITIFKNGANKSDYLKALELAFSHDQTVLVEYFVEGKEYRFFVIGDEVVGILHRIPANVRGDGTHTIAELVTIKNQDPLRGKGYKTPLEKIALGQVETMFLQEQGLGTDSIIEKNQVVYLRENSNVSTGGDSIDFTDDISDSYKAIAVKSAKAVGAVICGVDMMLTDIKQYNDAYAIIELNFNPAIHIHCYPYQGKNRKLGEKILDKLGF